MRIVFTIFLATLLSFNLIAQRQISGEEVIEMIRNGETIALENYAIEGPLDFTTIDESFKQEESGFFERFFTNNDYKNYSYDVEIPVNFNNCEFNGPVIAYYHNGNSTYNANFTKAAIFSNCRFSDEAAFKYSHFDGEVDFSGSVFDEEGLFKYAQFKEGADFSDAVFNDVANFKYAKFPEEVTFQKVMFNNYTDFKYVTFPNQVNFEDAIFEEEANFKYTHFSDGVTFGDAIFSGFANFKYTEFSKPLDLDKVQFSGHTDFKYTKVDGMEFNQFLLTQQ